MDHNKTEFGNDTHPWLSKNRHHQRGPFPPSPIIENIKYFNLSVTPFHICNILLIVFKRDLHKNVFILLANLSVSDIFLQVFLYLIKTHRSKALHIALSTFGTASILFTLAINLDRYLKVKFGLRYYEIVLTERLTIAIILTWPFAVLFCVIPMASIGDDDKRLLTTFQLGFNIFFSFVMLLSSMWVVRTRNMHARAIKQQEDAVAKARYDREAATSSSTQMAARRRRPLADMAQLLSSIKKATREVIRLSFISAFLIIVGSALHILELYSRNIVLHMMGIFANEIYIISNPFVYIFVMGDLRNHYIDHLRQFFRLLRPIRQVNEDGGYPTTQAVRFRTANFEAATPKAASIEAATTEAATTEAATTETATTEAATTEAATTEAANIEAATTEATNIEVATTEATNIDAATIEAATTEATNIDAATTEAANFEAATTEATNN